MLFIFASVLRDLFKLRQVIKRPHQGPRSLYTLFINNASSPRSLTQNNVAPATAAGISDSGRLLRQPAPSNAVSSDDCPSARCASLAGERQGPLQVSIQPADVGPVYLVDERPSTGAGDPFASAPQQPSVYYVIPGCYAGDVKPEDVRLPTNCDPTRAVKVSR